MSGMKFKRQTWQKAAVRQLKRKGLSYRKLEGLIRLDHTTIWRMFTASQYPIDVEWYLLICRYLDMNPTDYIVGDEVQLKLL